MSGMTNQIAAKAVPENIGGANKIIDRKTY